MRASENQSSFTRTATKIRERCKSKFPSIIKLSTVALFVLGATLLAAAPVSDLEKGFTRPPDSARPWVYWFWLNGNITSNGITADLEAMRRVGAGDTHSGC